MTDCLTSFSDLAKCVWSKESDKFVGDTLRRIQSLFHLQHDYFYQLLFALPRLEGLIEESKKEVDKQFEDFPEDESTIQEEI